MAGYHNSGIKNIESHNNITASEHVITYQKKKKDVDIEDDRLILEVQNYPELYDRRRPDYKDVVKREMAWATIAQTLNYPVDDCRYRWKNLRDKFVREKKRELINEKTGCVLASNRTWRLRHLMSFLNDSISHRRMRGSMQMELQEKAKFQECDILQTVFDNVSVSITEGASSDTCISAQMEDDEKEDSKPMPTLTSIPSSGSSTASDMTEIIESSPENGSRKRKCSQGQVKDDLSHLLHGTPINSNGSTIATIIGKPLDGDEHFCLSILPNLRRLQEHKKAEAKIKILELLYHLEFKPAHLP